MQAVLPLDLVPLPTAPYDQRPDSLPLDVEETRTALWLNRGNIMKTAATLKVTPARLRQYVNNNTYLSREQSEAREQLKDIAEDNVYDALTDEEDPARRDTMTRFVLGSIGKDRGFGTGGSGVSLNMNGKGKLEISWDDGTSLTGNDNAQPAEKVIEHEPGGSVNE